MLESYEYTSTSLTTTFMLSINIYEIQITCYSHIQFIERRRMVDAYACTAIPISVCAQSQMSEHMPSVMPST